MKLHTIDNGNEFDWGNASKEYAEYRDIYPQAFYDRLYKLGLCQKGQRVLDLGTGTGVLPRNMAEHGADFTGIDISENQIREAKRLSSLSNQNIHYFAVSIEEMHFPDNSFDVSTACQCFWYFDQEILFPKLYALLKPKGKFAILNMMWLPEEDAVASASEQLVLQYNPDWTGSGYKRVPELVPEASKALFTAASSVSFDADIPFTRTSWNGRIKACRGIGASLNEEEVHRFEKAHLAKLQEIAPETFTVKHHITMLVLQSKKS